MSNSASPQNPLLKPRKGISSIWLVPIASLLVGLWLLWVGIISSGKTISIEFPQGDGIVAGQTELRFKGIKVGVVKALEMKEDLSGVIATLELDKNVSKDIPEDTKFWLVEPKVTASGVSGLGTVFSGNYINVQIGSSKKQSKSFIALQDPPALSVDTPGLHISVETDKLGSLNEGDPILYKQIQIGTVQSHAMQDDNQTIKIGLFIKPEYAHLIGKNTRFWNASGIQVSGGLTGFKVQTEAITTLLAGGIAVSNRDKESEPAVNGDTFQLFEDYEAAGVGIRIKVNLPSAKNISEQTKLMYRGMQIGRVIHVNIDRKTGQFYATVGLKPQSEAFLKESTRLYLITPQISLAGISGLDAIVNGTYIAVDPNTTGKPVREFTVIEGNLPVDLRVPGLHITLNAANLSGINIGTPVLYRSLQVGSVESINLDEKNRNMQIHVLINDQYANLVKENTRFWNTSGLDIQAGLGGIQIKSDSLAGLLAGGITFSVPDEKAKPAQNSQQYILHKNQQAALSGLEASFELASAEGINPGMTKIIYQGLTIGTVESVQLLDNGRGVLAKAQFIKDAEPLLKADSYFWLVKPQISAATITGLDTLLSGPYITLIPGKGSSSRRFVVTSQAPAGNYNQPGLHIKLLSDDAAGLRSGSPILYKNLSAGEITEVRPAANGKIEIFAHIKPEYSHYISRNSRFWNANGLELKAGAGGIKLNTESVSALLSGGVVFDDVTATDTKATLSINNDQASAESVTRHSVKNGDSFQLHTSREAALNSGITIALIANNAGALNVGTPIMLQGVTVGQITALYINSKEQIVEATATLRNDLQAALNTGTSFHLRDVQLGLARNENLGAIINGAHIDMVTGDGMTRNTFPLLLSEPLTKRAATGLNLILSSDKLGSLKAGDPVTYRQVKVGTVLGTALNKTGQQVEVYINLWPGYEKLVRNNSQFWRSSGIRVEAGLFSGVDIKTESIETIVSGGIAFATPDDAEVQASANQNFELADEAKDSWLQWSPEL